MTADVEKCHIRKRCKMNIEAIKENKLQTLLQFAIPSIIAMMLE